MPSAGQPSAAATMPRRRGRRSRPAQRRPPTPDGSGRPGRCPASRRPRSARRRGRRDAGVPALPRNPGPRPASLLPRRVVGGGQGVEDLLGPPGRAVLVLDRHHTIGGHVQVEARVVPLREPVPGEREPEGAVYPRGVEDPQQVVEIADLLALVPHVVSLQPRQVALHVDDRPAHAALVAGSNVTAAAELGDRHRLAVLEPSLDQVGEVVLVRRVPVAVHRHDVEWRPVDLLPRPGRIGDLPAEPRPAVRRDGGQVVAELSAHRAHVRAEQVRDALGEGIAGDESGAEQAQLAPGDQHHVRPGLPQLLGPFRAVEQDRGRVLAGQLARERREPHLEAGVRGQPRRDLDPLRVRSGDPHRGAVQLPCDDLKFALDLGWVEVRAAGLAGRREAGVVVDAPAADAHLPASFLTMVSIGTEQKPHIPIAPKMATSMMTVPSHTIVPTGRVKAQTPRVTHSPMRKTPQISENIRSSRRNRIEDAASRSNAASLAASPLTRNGRSPAVISGRPANAETRIAIPIVLLTAPSLASMIRGSPDQKLIAMLTTLTATMSVARPFRVRFRTRPNTVRAAGAMLLSASEATRPHPAARSR